MGSAGGPLRETRRRESLGSLLQRNGQHRTSPPAGAGAVLKLIREGEAVTRADLARRTNPRGLTGGPAEEAGVDDRRYGMMVR